MTDRRDLKRRVRERQERTGESYMTALRHVRGGRQPVPVVEMLDVTEIAEPLGIRCRVTMSADLSDRAATALSELCRMLRTHATDPKLAAMRDVVFDGKHSWPLGPDIDTQFARQIRDGVAGVSDTGRVIALPVDGVTVVFTMWYDRFVAAARLGAQTEVAAKPLLFVSTVATSPWRLL